MKRGSSTTEVPKQSIKRPRREGDGRPTKKTVSKKARKVKKYTFIVLDLETTGLKSEPHITQITAMALDHEDPFNCFVLPKKDITYGAQTINHMRLTRAGLQLREQQVNAVKITEALKQFLRWLKQFPNVILVAHYGRSFEFALLLLAAKNTGYQDKLLRRVRGYVDSCELFRKFYPGLQNHKKETLINSNFPGQPYRKHGAIVDITNFRNLINTKFENRERLLLSRFGHSEICLDDITQEGEY